MAASSSTTFGMASSSLAARFRSLPCQPKCAEMKRVFGCFLNRSSRSVASVFERDGHEVSAAIGEQGQLEPPLVVHVERLEELRRLRRYE